MNGVQQYELYCFPYDFIARVMPGHLPKMAFSGRIMPFQTTIYNFLFIKSPYINKLIQLMSMNGGQTLHLSFFPTYIHTQRDLTKKAFSGRMMQFEL